MADRTDAQKAAEARAAEQRKEYMRALENELEGYERTGNKDRIADVKAEIARAKKEAPAGRTAGNGQSQT